MSNMSYCRFHNTLLDLRECQEVLGEFESGDERPAELSRDEARAALRLLEVCGEIAELLEDSTLLVGLRVAAIRKL